MSIYVDINTSKGGSGGRTLGCNGLDPSVWQIDPAW